MSYLSSSATVLDILWASERSHWSSFKPSRCAAASATTFVSRRRYHVGFRLCVVTTCCMRSYISTGSAFVYAPRNWPGSRRRAAGAAAAGCDINVQLHGFSLRSSNPRTVKAKLRVRYGNATQENQPCEGSLLHVIRKKYDKLKKSHSYERRVTIIEAIPDRFVWRGRLMQHFIEFCFFKSMRCMRLMTLYTSWWTNVDISLEQSNLFAYVNYLYALCSFVYSF